jgi:hypothetical protein
VFSKGEITNPVARASLESTSSAGVPARGLMRHRPEAQARRPALLTHSLCPPITGLSTFESYFWDSTLAVGASFFLQFEIQLGVFIALKDQNLIALHGECASDELRGNR